MDGNVYVIEEEVHLTDGVYEAALEHDNINPATLAVYTGPKLTGERIQSYALSTPSLMPWKKVIRVYADVPVVYISYETDGDMVEAEDINRVQDTIVGTQEALNAEESRAMDAEAELTEDLRRETGRAQTEESRLDDRIDTESGRAQGAELVLRDDLAAETQRAKTAEQANADQLTAEVTRATGAEKTLSDNLAAETARAATEEKTLTDKLAGEVTRAKTAEKVNSDAVTAEKSRAAAAEEVIRNTISTNKPNWDDKYTRNEVDNKFSALETAIDWKEAVDTYADLAAVYPHPDDGWTVNVKDTDYTYRWSGTAWVAISANAIPKATQSVDGLLSREDKTAYDDAYSKRHTHGNKSTLDKLTETLLANWSDAYGKRHEHGNKSVLDKITQALFDNWSAAYTHVSNKSNPHGVTKSQVGLGNVPNVATNDQTPTFTPAAALTNLTSGEKLTVTLGKLAKAEEDFIAHKADAVQHITAAERTNWNDSNSKKHTHSNKSILDMVTQAMLDKLAGIAEGANKYVHPTTAGNKHVPSGGASGQILRWSADGTAVWGADNNTTYSVFKAATTSAAGGIGLVPAPSAGSQANFLRADGTWQTPAGIEYTHPSSGVTAGTYRSVTVNAQGHVETGTNPTTLAGYGITDAATKNHNHDSTYLKKGVVTWADLKGGS